MSYEAREWVWDQSTSKGTARHVLVLLADRCVDRRFIAYASVPTLMKRANASRSAVREGLDKLIDSGELIALDDRTGPRGETYYHLPAAARALAGQPAAEPHEGDRNPVARGSESDPVAPSGTGPDSDPRDRNPTPEGTGIQPRRGPESNPGGDRNPTPRTVVNRR